MRSRSFRPTRSELMRMLTDAGWRNAELIRETADLNDYRAGFLTGRDACRWIVDTLNGPEPAAIWGLSDGDAGWQAAGDRQC